VPFVPSRTADDLTVSYLDVHADNVQSLNGNLRLVFLRPEASTPLLNFLIFSGQNFMLESSGHGYEIVALRLFPATYDRSGAVSPLKTRNVAVCA
jgi:hypothetical protein